MYFIKCNNKNAQGVRLVATLYAQLKLLREAKRIAIFFFEIIDSIDMSIQIKVLIVSIDKLNFSYFSLPYPTDIHFRLQGI